MSFLLSKPLARTFVTEGWGHARSGRLHAGLDLRAPVGTPVFAAANGSVFFAGPYADGSGNAIELDHGDGMATRYLHLSRIDVKRGQSVRAGTQIGLTGHAVSPHLHFDSWVLPAQVPTFIATFGQPGGGITQSKSVAGRIRFKVPSEPLVVIDEFQSDVLAMMREFNVRGRSQFPNFQNSSSLAAGPTGPGPGSMASGGVIAFAGLMLAGIAMMVGGKRG